MNRLKKQTVRQKHKVTPYHKYIYDTDWMILNRYFYWLNKFRDCYHDIFCSQYINLPIYSVKMICPIIITVALIYQFGSWTVKDENKSQ